MYDMEKDVRKRYAKLLLSALNSNEGLNEGEVILLQVPESAKPMLKELRDEITRQGCHFITDYQPQEVSRGFYELADEDQLEFFPENYLRGLVDDIDHRIKIVSEVDKQELKGVDPKKIMKKIESFNQFKEWLTKKENKGEFTWTMALYPTEEMAAEANMSLEEYTQQIVKACFLDKDDTIERWRETVSTINKIKDRLNELDIEKVHVDSEGTDLTVKIGDNRKWMGGSGRNVPSFEIFISPDWRGTQGHISFDQPLYRYGNLINDIYLEFEDGKVVEASASEGEDVLKEMINSENADKVGEYSLTDSRFSRITEFMANTLYDENVGGEYGNTHIALGRAYKDSYPGDEGNVSDEEWEEMGYNTSPIHTDIISTKDRTVTATLEDGSEKVIFEDGEFQV